MKAHASRLRAWIRSHGASRAVFTFLVAGGLSACLSPAANRTSAMIDAAPATTTPTDATDTGDLYASFYTAWEGSPTDFTLQDTCKIDYGSASTSQTCTIRVPEAQMHFSKLKIAYGTSNTSMCKILIFRPYFYLGSQDAVATVDWDSTVSPVCNDTVVGTVAGGGPASPDCYNGPAKEVVPDFPNYTGVYFLTAEGEETSYTISSANEKFQGKNRWACNNNPTPGVGIVNEYIANSNRAYVFQCRDQYYQLLKTVNVYLADQDLEAGEDPGTANDDFDDWGDL